MGNAIAAFDPSEMALTDDEPVGLEEAGDSGTRRVIDEVNMAAEVARLHGIAEPHRRLEEARLRRINEVILSGHCDQTDWRDRIVDRRDQAQVAHQTPYPLADQGHPLAIDAAAAAELASQRDGTSESGRDR